MVTKKDKHLAAAQKFLERGQLDKALAEFTKVVQEDPKDTRTWLKMAELHAKRGAANQATDIYLKTGELYTEQGFFQKAVAVYKNVLKLSPSYVQGHFKLADVYKRLGLMSDAAQQLEQAVAALQKAGKSVEVLAALRQMVEISPDNVVSRIKLAESASQAGLTEEAIQELAKAAEQLRSQGRTDEYIRVGERLLFLQPDNMGVARQLAESYIGKKNARLALAKLQACLKAQPREPETVSLLARAFEQLDVPKAVSVWKELAQIHHEAGRLGERNEALQKALALDPKDAEALESMGRYGMGSGGSPAARGPGPPGMVSLRPPPQDSFFVNRPPSSPHDTHGVKRTGGTGASGATLPPAGAPGTNQDIARIMAESEVFVKYGLLDRAVDHLRRIFEIQADYQPAHDRLAAVLAKLGKSPEAASPPAAPAPAPAPAPAAAPAAPVAAPELVATPEPVAAPPVAALHEPMELVGTADLEFELNPDDEEPEVLSFEEDPASSIVTPPPEFTPGVATTIGELDRGSATTLGSFDEPAATTIGSFEDPSATSIGAYESAAPNIFIGGMATVIGATDPELVSELEQVDFFIEQSMADEARQMLVELKLRFGAHPIIEQKMQNALRLLDPGPGAIPRHSTPGSDESDFDSFQSTPPPVAVVAGGGQADLSTHGDLGIAYKEMGLFDPAIAEFKLLMHDPQRNVFALTMIGECFEAKGSITDAVIRYKEALNSPIATETETTELYYLLGSAFEHLNDLNEAVYFYEKVSRRDPKFREVETKLAALKPRSVRQA